MLIALAAEWTVYFALGTFLELNMPPKKMHALATIAIIAFGAFAYVQQIPGQGWVSDDYAEVFDNGVTPYTGFSQTLKLCGNGHYTVARLLGLPFKLYLGYWLGPVGSHYLQAALHIACALVFFRLLLSLDFPLFTSTLAAVIFVVSPWLSQAAIWWATVITPAGTLCILLAACVYVRMLKGQLRRVVALAVVCLLVIASLSFYELWLFAPLLFFSIDLYFSLNRAERLSIDICLQSLRRAAINCCSIVAVLLLWAIAYKLTQVNQVREGHVVPRRVLPVLVSIHWRAYSWITRTPWRTALRDGVQYAGAWWIVLLAGALSFPAFANSSVAKIPGPHRRRQLLLRALLAWGIFLASRLVFVFMTGIGFFTRHNYGAALGVALLIACVCEYAFASLGNHRGIRAAVTVLILLALSLLATTSAGIRHHYAATARAEKLTVQMLTPIAAELPPGDSILVIGPATNTRGELGYFSEMTGQWLEKLLQNMNPGIHAYVVSSASFTGNAVTIRVTDRTEKSCELQLDLRHTRVFKWADGALEPAPNPGEKK